MSTDLSVSSSFFSALYKCRQNVLNILSKCNYDVSEYINFRAHELHAMMKNDEMDMLVTKENGTKKTYVKFFELTGKQSKLLRQPIIEEMIEEMINFDKEEALKEIYLKEKGFVTASSNELPPITN